MSRVETEFRLIDREGNWVFETRDSEEHAEELREGLDDRVPSAAPHEIEEVEVVV